jgi:hypothetical protein
MAQNTNNGLGIIRRVDFGQEVLLLYKYENYLPLESHMRFPEFQYYPSRNSGYRCVNRKTWGKKLGNFHVLLNLMKNKKINNNNRKKR